MSPTTGRTILEFIPCVEKYHTLRTTDATRFRIRVGFVWVEDPIFFLFGGERPDEFELDVSNFDGRLEKKEFRDVMDSADKVEYLSEYLKLVRHTRRQDSPEFSRKGFLRMVSLGDLAKLPPGMRLPWPLGCTLNRLSLSRSVGKSSIASSSVPSPYVRIRFGLRSTLGAKGVDVCEASLEVEAGRGGRGDTVRRRGGGCTLPDGDEQKTAGNAGRDLRRPDVGTVRR